MNRLFVAFLEFLPLWLFIKILGLFEYKKRISFGSLVIAFLIRKIPKYRLRVQKNLNIVYPQMSSQDRAYFLKTFSNQLGLTFVEFLFNSDYHLSQKILFVDKAQLSEVEKATNKNEPVIIVSGHLGPWEAVRALLKRNGIETGAVYQKSKNPFYQPLHHERIEAGGKPIFQVGRKGTMSMIRFLRKGGILCIMIDQAVPDGEYVNFLGTPAKTSLAVAKIALKCKAKIIPAYATRNISEDTVEVEFEKPIPHGTPMEMTQEINRSLSAKIYNNPTQWYWVHNRWK